MLSACLHRFKAKGLALTDVTEHLKTCQQLLADLRCLSSNWDVSHLEIKPNPDSPEAQDVVDLILCGTPHWIIDFGPGKGQTTRPWWQGRRQGYYERLHAAQDAAGEPEAPFNEGRFQPDLTEK